MTNTELTEAIGRALRDQTITQLIKTTNPNKIQEWILSHSHILGAESFRTLNRAYRAQWG